LYEKDNKTYPKTLMNHQECRAGATLTLKTDQFENSADVKSVSDQFQNSADVKSVSN